MKVNMKNPTKKNFENMLIDEKNLDSIIAHCEYERLINMGYDKKKAHDEVFGKRKQKS